MRIYKSEKVAKFSQKQRECTLDTSLAIIGKVLGFTLTQENLNVPMNDNDLNRFLIDYLRLTEKGYEELCKNSPSTYPKSTKAFMSSPVMEVRQLRVTVRLLIMLSVKMNLAKRS